MTNKKSNKALRAALVLCVLALFCAAFVGATFAKYVTADKADDTARAAKWGISLSIGGTLFGAQYDVTTAGVKADSIVADSVSTVTVSSDGGDDVVAPGTKNEVGFTVAINGDPEVDYDVEVVDNSADIEDIFLAAGKWGTMVPAYGLTAENFAEGSAVYYASEDDGATFRTAVVDDLVDPDVDIYELHDAIKLANAYYPIEWTVTASGTQAPAIATTRNLNTIAAEIRTNLDEIDGSADAAVDAKYVLTWEWAFEQTDMNAADTTIGNLAANNANAIVVFAADDVAPYAAADAANYNLTVAFGLDVTVTQVN